MVFLAGDDDVGQFPERIADAGEDHGLDARWAPAAGVRRRQEAGEVASGILPLVVQHQECGSGRKL